ncbi:H-NS histone family protein [Acidovorax sp. Leaf84]|uniref:H-NS histone family protein n=1 Tax=Acidovorax sp. Leaf84 TaxID=1736240 RepID=UPI003FA417FD
MSVSSFSDSSCRTSIQTCPPGALVLNFFGFTAQQVFPWKPIVKKVAQKYRDEKSGATWTGRGRAPAWIAGKNRDDFLIVRPRSQEGPFLAEMAAASAGSQG